VVRANVVAGCFAALAGVVFLLFAAVHLRPRPTLIRGRTVALACVLAVLFPLFLEPIHELLRALLLGEPYTRRALLQLGLFVLVTAGVAWYFRGWLLFNVDTRALAELLRESCAAVGIPCREVGPEAGRQFRLGREERSLYVRPEPESRYASLRVSPHRDVPWAEELSGELRRRLSLQHTGRYYSRALIYLLIGLVCLGLAAILFSPERLGLLPLSGLPPTPF
jgi:hypothetical protein